MVQPDGPHPGALKRVTIPVTMTAVADTAAPTARPVKGAPLGWLFDNHFGWARYEAAAFPDLPVGQPIVKDSTAFDSAVIEVVLRSAAGVEGASTPDSMRFSVYALDEEVPVDSSFPLHKRWHTSEWWGSLSVAYNAQLGGFAIPMSDGPARRIFQAYYARDSVSNDWLRKVLKGVYLAVDSPAQSLSGPSGWLAHVVFEGTARSGIRIYFSDSLSLFLPFSPRAAYPSWQYNRQGATIDNVIAGNDSLPLWLSPGGTQLRVRFPSLSSYFEGDPHRMTAHQATLHLPFRQTSHDYVLIMPPRLTLTTPNGIEPAELSSPLYGFHPEGSEALFHLPLYFHDSLLKNDGGILFINLPGSGAADPARVWWSDTSQAKPRLEVTYSEN